MAAAAVTPLPAPEPGPSAPTDDLPRPSAATPGDSQDLCKRAETCELESDALLIDPVLFKILDGLLLETYAMLRPKPVDYEHRYTMIDIFNKIAKDISGRKDEFPVVEPFGSFTMDLFTTKSDLDLSVNFSNDMDGQFARKDRISFIRKLANVLRNHQRRGRCYGVLPIVSAKVPVLKVTDKGTGVECDISVENKDGMSRSVIFKLVSSIDERFPILCYLMKSWAKKYDVNCPRDRTMSSMAIISLVAFHLQTRHPPILPAFSGLLKDGSDFASVERNIVVFKGFGSTNKESVAELFVSLMTKLLAVEDLWEQGLCASNFDGFWISKTWSRGIGNLSVEDFLDRSQNFARAVGKEEMQNICECLKDTVSKLTDFFRGNIDAPTLKNLIFGALNKDVPVSPPGPKHVKSKRKRGSQCDPGNSQKQQKKGKHTVQPGHAANKTAASLPTTTVLNQDVPVSHPSPKHVNSKPKMDSQCDPGNTQKQQKKVKHTVQPGHAADETAASLPMTTVLNQHVPVSHPSPKDVNSKPKLDSQCDPGNTQKQQKKGKHTVQPGHAANKTSASLPTTTVLNQHVPVSHPSPKDVNSKPKMDSQCDPGNTQKQQKKGIHTVQPGRAANKTAASLPATTVLNQDVPVSHPSPKQVNSKPKMDSQCDSGNTQKQQKKGKHTVQPGRPANKAAASLPATTVLNQDVPVSHPSPKQVNSKRKMDSQCDPENTQKQQKKGKHTVQPGSAANKTAARLPTTTVFRPPHVHQVGYTQPFNQFVHRSQHPIPSRLAYGYGSPQEHLHPAPYMTGQPHGSFMHWTDPGIHLQQQAQHMFVPLPVQQPAINRSFHPYGFNGPQQVQFDDYSRLPYRFNPNYEFNGAQHFPFDDHSRLPYGFNPNYEFNGAHRFQFDDYSRLPNGFNPYYRRV